MAVRSDVTPNRRGARSRELVLDAAERLVAEHGYEAVSIVALEKGSGIPMSSIYHYFGSKIGVLLAVMDRGAQRFYAAIPDVEEPLGRPAEHLRILLDTVTDALNQHPDFLRLLVAMAAQPPTTGDGDVSAVISQIRDRALAMLSDQMRIAFGPHLEAEAVDNLARFTLAAFDGAFIAQQSDPRVSIHRVLVHLPAALVAIRREATGYVGSEPLSA